MLAASVVKSLGGTQGCEAAMKTQLGEIDNLEATVKSVSINGDTATAEVVASGKATNTSKRWSSSRNRAAGGSQA